MLSGSARSDMLPPFSAGVRAEPSPRDTRPALVVAVAADDVDRFPVLPFARFAARTTTEAIRLVERWRPRVVAIDWDLTEFDREAICTAARRLAGTGILVTMAAPEAAPAALKAGCHGVLLKPFAPNLAAARLGRLSRELPSAPVAARLPEKLGQFGTNRACSDVACPSCGEPGAVSFEYSSHRRTWYACLACDRVWLGRRRE